MLKGIKIKLDPTPQQERMFASNAGGARFAYNFLLRRVKQSLGGVIDTFDWSHYSLRRMWNEWKYDVAPWWANNAKEAYSYGCECLAHGLKNWDDSRKGKRKGRKVGFPKLKSRRTMMRFAYTTGVFGVADDYGIKLPRIGRVHCFENVATRVGGAKIKRIAITKQPDGWFASLLVDTPNPKLLATLHGSVGIDLGVKHMATLSNGQVIENTATDSRLERKAKRLQRSISRSQTGSKRKRKKLTRLAKIKHRQANKRRDMLDKLTTKLATTYNTIGIEDLNVSGMTRKPKPKPDPNKPGKYLKNGRKAKAGLNKRILDNGFYMFRQMLDYKCKQTGATLIIHDRYFASSKTCANCGTVKTKLSLKQRTYHCKQCGSVLDRDLNAAINLNPVGPSAEHDLKRAWRTNKTPTNGARFTNPRFGERNANQATNSVRLGANLDTRLCQQKQTS